MWEATGTIPMKPLEGACLRVHSFPVGTVADHHKLSGFKQQKCVLLEFWQPDV